jgi:hypothetical protein
MLLGQRAKFQWANAPANYTGAASTDLYVSLRKYGRLVIQIITGAWAAGTAAVTLKQATAVAGTSAKALAFDTMWTDKAVNGTLVKTAVVANTFNLDTANSLWIIEVDARTLDLTTSPQFTAAAVDIASPGANNDYYAVAYTMWDARYQQDAQPSVLVD